MGEVLKENQQGDEQEEEQQQEDEGEDIESALSKMARTM